MTVKVKLYGDYLKYGPEETYINIEDNSTVEDVLNKFGIEERKYIIVLVNLKRAWFDDKLNEGDVVSVFSPVGGG
ncbi:MoaD/ThiS family protein [Caldisericum exile]|uniref:ThiamineS family protein n=1 Tax=Caldisericum exile (strain DSM 21853 / NBRC 104410 / AZM16c01) TaxID=511051 RepID=A0A7U6GEQ8_CALEA|nr:MoaD/ThiS family protein [Caldisericum exile]BAL81016.1 thiamineS family protein [Caldisericum exile AZM16c01]